MLRLKNNVYTVINTSVFTSFLLRSPFIYKISRTQHLIVGQSGKMQLRGYGRDAATGAPPEIPTMAG